MACVIVSQRFVAHDLRQYPNRRQNISVFSKALRTLMHSKAVVQATTVKSYYHGGVFGKEIEADEVLLFHSPSLTGFGSISFHRRLLVRSC